MILKAKNAVKNSKWEHIYITAKDGGSVTSQIGQPFRILAEIYGQSSM